MASIRADNARGGISIKLLVATLCTASLCWALVYILVILLVIGCFDTPSYERGGRICRHYEHGGFLAMALLSFGTQIVGSVLALIKSRAIYLVTGFCLALLVAVVYGLLIPLPL